MHAVVLVSNLLMPTLRALAFAQATAPATLRAVKVSAEDATDPLPEEWSERGVPMPLVVIESPYRETVRPLLLYVRQLRRDYPGDVISIIIPEYVVRHWWQNLLHNQTALRLKARLLFEPSVTVTSVPWVIGSPGSERRRADHLHPLRGPAGRVVPSERRASRAGPAQARRRRRRRDRGLALLTLLLTHTRDTFSLESQVLLYLLAVVVVAVVGGMAVALGSAIAAAFLINYYFVRPEHTLQVAQGEQALALVVFLIVAAIVSGAVELAARRGRVAEQAALQAETLSALAGGELDESESLHGILERARNTFQMESVALKAREGGDWTVVDEVGWAPPGEEAPLRFDVPMGPRLRLLGRGGALFAQDQRVLQAFAAAAQTAYEGQRLSARAERARARHGGSPAHRAARGRRPRPAHAAGRDQGLRVDPAPDRRQLVPRGARRAARDDRGVGRPARLDRRQPARRQSAAGRRAVRAVPGGGARRGDRRGPAGGPGAAERVTLDVPEDLPLVEADPGLLERVLANLLENAVRYGSNNQPIEVTAAAGGTTATLEVVDHGPGVPEDRREGMFQPFQHADDHGTARGVGLGPVSVARGFMEAMDGILIADSSSGTGLTMRLRLPLAQ